MTRNTLLQVLSIASLIIILGLDTRTPLGFAHGDLYLFSILLAALSGSQRLLTGVAIMSVLFTALGALISPPGLAIEYWLANRALSVLELTVISVLTSF